MNSAAARQLRGAWVDGVALETRDGRILLNRVSTSSCIEYETRFEPRWSGLANSSVAVLSQAQWLWRPNPFPSEVNASIRFVLPGGGRASLPWRDSNGVFQPERSALFVESFAVFGVFDRQAFSVANTQVEVVHLGTRPPEADIRRWLIRAMQTTAFVGGRFPRDRLLFVIAPVDDGGSEVAFGMVRRGGGTSVLLRPSMDAEAPELESDWVAIHELSHLWLPRLQADGRWLSEGIATYLQEVLRARCGLQSSEQAWRRIHEGFERGRRSGSGRPLADESLRMHQTGAYQRVYWAGTAFALETDVRLRLASGGKRTLLSALSEAQRDWGGEVEPVSARRVLADLDRASGADFIEELGQQYAARSDFPDTSYVDAPAYRGLREQIGAQAAGGCKINGESSP